jgi:hypothetical protein
VSYTEPVRELTRLGQPTLEAWPEYSDLGLGEEHVSELIELATDGRFFDADVTEPEVYASIHAWRALAQLESEEAIGPLVGVLAEAEESDWAGEELPLVFERFGSAAVSRLVEYVKGVENGVYARATAGAALTRIATNEESVRDEVIGALTNCVERFAENRSDLNGLLIGNLLDLHAVEAAPAIQRAYAGTAVDLWVNGDWEDVQAELGLASVRSTKRRVGSYRTLRRAVETAGPRRGAQPRARNETKAHKKAKRKKARDSRKRNRGK